MLLLLLSVLSDEYCTIRVESCWDYNKQQATHTEAMLITMRQANSVCCFLLHCYSTDQIWCIPLVGAMLTSFCELIEASLTIHRSTLQSIWDPTPPSCDQTSLLEQNGSHDLIIESRGLKVKLVLLTFSLIGLHDGQKLQVHVLPVLPTFLRRCSWTLRI